MRRTDLTSTLTLPVNFDRPHLIKIALKAHSNDDNIAYSLLYNAIVNVLSKICHLK